MEYLVNNWYLIAAALSVIVAAAIFVWKFCKLPTDKQLAKVKEWLLYAVIMAEKELGGGTGKLKLRYVYDLFLTKFNWLAGVVSFEKFSGLVDEALEEMHKVLDTNKNVKQLVESEEKTL
jgi:hypothetical protein